MTTVIAHQPLWARLRTATKSLHAEAETALDPLTRPADQAGYAQLLTALWGFQAPAEYQLGRAGLPAAVRWADRARLAALAADLADLGIDSASLPRVSGLPGPDSAGAAWGVLYVAEGATLGSRVIRRRVLDRIGPAPDRFLAGHGDRTRQWWRELGRTADTHVRTEQEARAAEHTASAAFAAFTSWARRLQACTAAQAASSVRASRAPHGNQSRPGEATPGIP